MMILGTLPHGNITVLGSTVETVNEFCYLGSIIQDDSSCDKDIRARLGKANGVFGRLTNIWRDNGLSLHTKFRLYDALVLSTSTTHALAEGSRADCIQTISSRVQVSTRVRTCIPY